MPIHMGFERVVQCMPHHVQQCLLHLYRLPIEVNGQYPRYWMHSSSGQIVETASSADAWQCWTSMMKHLRLYVKRAMHVCYGVILDNHAEEEQDPTSMHTICLASLLYHSDFLIQVESEHPSRPFSSIPILQADDLLSKLKDLVTLKPSDDVPFANGIPPHIYQAKTINKVLALCEGTPNEIRNLTATKMETSNQTQQLSWELPSQLALTTQTTVLCLVTNHHHLIQAANAKLEPSQARC